MDEIGFLDRFLADALLKKAGVASIDAAVALPRLFQEARRGHLCMKKDQLGQEILSLPSSILGEGSSLFPKTPIVVDEDRYYLQKNWVYETYILQHIMRLVKGSSPFFFDKEAFEKHISLVSGKLTDGQMRAMRQVLKQPMTVICGGPGTGKTYTAAYLVNLLFRSLKKREKEHLHVHVAAPTGKAASHLQCALQMQGCIDEKLHIEASTLHKLLKLQPGASRLFMRKGKIDADLIIVDEASMIDVSLFAHLLEAIGDDTLLILIGDPHQLPPVDACSLFAEISQLFGVFLDRCMRTEDIFLQKFAQAVKQGDQEDVFKLMPAWNESISVDTFYEKIDPIFYHGFPDPKACFQTYGKFRILNPIRKGPNGTNALNARIFQDLQKNGKWWSAPIIAIANDAFSEIYNGMSGILIGQKNHIEAAYFPDARSAEMRRFSAPPPYELSFCMSIHKAQGSEFEEVLALFPEGSENFGREALYTAVTRAKKRVEIRGQKEVLEKMIAATSNRMSGLSRRIRAKNWPPPE
ncbi:MAG TPA: AAA family ATPase [Chlamydiales bacterium]|nr:AAA family ATPase [Chlamydiales bacterium]